MYLNYIRSEDLDSVRALEEAFDALLDNLNRNGITYHLADETLLKKYGKVEEDHSCRKFKYDLLKREPMARREMPKLEFVSLDDDEENEEPKEDTNENDTGKEIWQSDRNARIW